MEILQTIKKIPAKSALSITAITFAIIWFVLPLLSFGNAYPFENKGVRIFILLCILVSANFKRISSFIKSNKEQTLNVIIVRTKSYFQIAKSWISNGMTHSKSALKGAQYRLKSDKKHRELRKKPWYIVIGSEHSGKKTTISNSGLSFIRPENIGAEAMRYKNTFPDFDWWFSDQGLFIDPMIYDDETDNVSWRKFIKLLRKERKQKPINGIILTISLPEVVTLNHQDRQALIHKLSQHVRLAHESFKSQVPVYLIFTKTDQIEGFMEFFNDMSKEELNQPWGMAFPLNQSTDMNKVRLHFDNEYKVLINQLRKRVIWSFDTERNMHARELINNFPQQLQLLKKPIENVLMELYASVRYSNAVQLRGLYFISNTQSGEVNDFLLQAMSKKFQLVPPTTQRPERLGECYFLRRLFQEVILPEASILGDSERSKRLKKLGYTSSKILAPTLILLAATSMYKGYSQNKNDIAQASQIISFYQSSLKKTNLSDKSVNAIVPLIEKLNSAYNIFNNQPWTTKTLYETSSIRRQLYNALQRSLHTYYLPRVAAQLESTLDKKIDDQNFLYATLKGYLAFSASNFTNRYAINAPMDVIWNKEYLDHPQSLNNLKHYLTLALQNPVEKLPLNTNLINKIRDRLEQVIPSDRAYGLLSLRASVSEIAPLNIRNIVGGNFDKIFTTPSHRKNAVTLPVLYTAKGYQNVFKPQYKAIANEVSEDNQDIGLSTGNSAGQSSRQIQQIIEAKYNKEYKKHWNNALSNIRVKQFTNLKEAINALQTLTSTQSPLPTLLNVINNNTNSISTGEVNIENTFKDIDAYSQGEAFGPSLGKTQKIITKALTYLQSIEKSKDSNKAAYTAALEAINGKDTPIQDLANNANESPSYAKAWLTQLSNSCWNIIVKNAHNYMQTVWDNDVNQEYLNNIANRYPLANTNESQITINNFNHFFGNQGTLEKYFNSVIKPFIDTSKRQWKMIDNNGYTIQLAEQTIELFHQANKIRDDYFPNNAKSATIKFSLKPTDLSSSAKSITLAFGNNNIVYRHGPHLTTQVAWPMPENDQDSSIVITTFDGNDFSMSPNGPWSLFNIISHGELKETGNNGTYTLNFKFNNQRASYLLNGTSNKNVFTLSDLKKFHVNKNMFMTNKKDHS